MIYVTPLTGGGIILEGLVFFSVYHNGDMISPSLVLSSRLNPDEAIVAFWRTLVLVHT